jgi:hypothetical protein
MSSSDIANTSIASEAKEDIIAVSASVETTKQLEIDTIFTESTEVDVVKTLLSEQFVVGIKELEKRFPVKPLSPEQIANMYRTTSQGLIDVCSIVKKSREVIEVAQPKKMSKAAAKIIESNIKQKQEKQIADILIQMKADQTDLISGDVPTIVSVKGILNKYTTSMSNKLMQIIVLKSLLSRYIESNDEKLVPLIFEFTLLMYDIKSEWFEEKEDEQKPVCAEPVQGRVNHRLARQQASKQAVKSSDFDLPTIQELMADTLSERIKIAINHTVTETKKILDSKQIDSIKYQMVEIYYRLKPINTWKNNKLKLDDWQLQIIDLIDKKESVVIMAPTSSGKTVCAQYCAVHEGNKKVLFVVPSNVLAIQVAGSFANSGIKTALIINEEEYGQLDESKVIVATPNKAEEILLMSNLQLDYVVFDEIQEINGSEGASIERLIRIIKCPFVILSATIHEPEKFVEYLIATVHKQVNLVTYKKRFIVQQKHLWEGNQLINLHPLSCIDTKYIIEEKFVSGDLAMTARDLYVLGTDLSESFPEYNVWKLHPNSYFKPYESITMDQISAYEQHLKDSLIKLALLNGEAITSFLQKYKISDVEQCMFDEKDFISKIVDLFKTLKTKNMLPALVFMLNDVAVLDIFKKVIEYLERIEAHYFPWLNSFMEKLYEEVNEYNENEETLKASISKSISGHGSKIKQINDALNQNKRQFISSFMNKLMLKYANEKAKALTNPELTKAEKDMVTAFLDSDYKYKHNQYISCQANSLEVKLPEFNPYSPTSIFSFHKTPLSVDVMRTITKNLRKFLGQNLDKRVSKKDMSYDNIFVRGLERGIILYSKVLPTAFQRIVQELIISHQAPICMSDDSLAYGVNFPTRTVVILGTKPNEEVDVLKSQQMSGRSGRRGYDDRGHIVYFSVNFKTIMRGTYTPLVGTNPITPYILLPAKIFSEIDANEFISSVIELPLSEYSTNKSTVWDKQELLDGFKELYSTSDLYKQDGIMSLLLWLFRDNVNIVPNLLILINTLLKISNGKVSINVQQSIVDKETKTVTVYDMQKILLLQIIELLFKVLDNDKDVDEDESEVTYKLISKEADFISIVNTTSWTIPLNRSNDNIIMSVIHNKIESDDFGDIASTVSSLNKVILNTLKVYNMFAQIGNQKMVSILDQPLTYLINFANKVKSLNE